MLIKHVIHDAKTGETRIEETEVEMPSIEESSVIQPPSLEERLKSTEDMILLLMEAGLMP